jgi:succinate dehydrogenase/fumarate reductase cytochrome b subunit
MAFRHCLEQLKITFILEILFSFSGFFLFFFLHFRLLSFWFPPAEAIEHVEEGDSNIDEDDQ